MIGTSRWRGIRLTELRGHLCQPVDGASLAVFRLALGVLGCVLLSRYLFYGWAARQFAQSPIHLSYPGFAWIPRPDPSWVEPLFALAALAALFIAIGSWVSAGLCRIAMVVFVVIFGWVELLDPTNYVNHHYFLIVAVFLLLASGQVPRLTRDGRGSLVPRWLLFAVRTQVGLVYFFAGVAKLNPDWLAGQPLAIWLPQRADGWPFGALLGLGALPLLMSWAGAIFDLSVAFALSWRRLRVPAFVAVVVFHSLTWALFPRLGIFPWMMVLGATTFFEPSWPRNVLARLRALRGRSGHSRSLFSVPWVPSGRGAFAVGLLLVVQLVLPLRHLALSDDVNWSEAGYRFSWRVMLNEKSGSLRYHYCDGPTTAPELSPNCRSVLPEDWFTPLQAERMAYQPTMIIEGAQRIAAHLEHEDGVAYADCWVSMNGRAARRLIDPTRDLLRVKTSQAQAVVVSRR